MATLDLVSAGETNWATQQNANLTALNTELIATTAKANAAQVAADLDDDTAALAADSESALRTELNAAIGENVYLLKRSTSIDVHDPAWNIDEMIGDGVSISSELQLILDESVADGRARRVELGRIYGLMASTLVVPTGAEIVGNGRGGFLTTAQLSASCLVREAGFNGDMIRFAAASIEGGRANIGPARLAGFGLYAQPGSTGGRGINFTAPDGTPGIIQDTVRVEEMLIRRQPEGGILVPAGARPLHFSDTNFLFNGGPGFEFIADQGTAQPNLASSIHLDAFSGDGNIGGLIVIRGGDSSAAFLITSMKSERRVNPHYGGSVAQQDNAIVLDNVASEVLLFGGTHISSIPNPGAGANIFEPPGAMFEVSGAALPRMRWQGSTVRVRDTDVENVVKPYMVLDSTRNANIDRSTTSGTYGQDEVSVARTKDRISVGESTVPRRDLASTGIAGSSGHGFLTYFTAEKTELVGSILTETQSTAAVGVAAAYVALYEENQATGDLTLVAASADTTTLWASANTEYNTVMTDQTKFKIRGRRYAVMILCAGTTMPNFGGTASMSATRAAKPPRLAARRNGISAPPSTIAAADLVATNLQFVADILPPA